MNPEKIRNDFPIFNQRSELVYLDNAATSQKPRKVINAVKEFYENKNSNIGRGLYDLANEATTSYSESRQRIADFIGAKTSNIVFVRNTTEAENLVASSLDFDGNIVLSRMSHHSEQLPWRRKAEEEGKEITYLETVDGRISLESAKEKISENTGLVAISQISNVFGAENPVEEIIEIAHEHNALVIVDAAQSVPHQGLDVQEQNADFICFSGHKMLGPSATGILYGRRELMEEMSPYQVGGGMISSVKENKVSYAEVPEKFEAGTPNVAGAIGLAAAVEYLESIGMKEISSHTRDLVREISRGLTDIDGIEVLSPPGSNLVSFRTEFAHPHDVAEVLNQHEVAVRAGMHCAQPQMEELRITGTTRASPYLYNTSEDVEDLIKAVKKVKNIF